MTFRIGNRTPQNWVDARSGLVTGTRIVTEESQRGALTKPIPLLNPNQEKMMLAGHQYLLDCIADAALSGRG